MGKKQKAKSGAEKFDEFYKEVYLDRWESLKKSLLEKKDHIILANPNLEIPDEWKSFHGYPHLYYKPEAELKNPKGESQFYFMDGASAFAPLLLDIQPADQVLDLCAAPGGKSLIMGYALGEEGRLTANDKSQDRRLRMLQNFKGFLGEEFVENQVRVTGFDAGAWCLHEKEAYNKILLDAPCSSERHVLESPHHLKDWREGRTKRLSNLQWTMLASAWLVLKKGGLLVYSTCSLSPLENDKVVSKLLKKFGDEVELIKPNIPGGEETDNGVILLPDQSGYGPFYLSLMKKN